MTQCCENCKGVIRDEEGFGTDYGCLNPSCPCHSTKDVPTGTSADTIGTPEQRKALMNLGRDNHSHKDPELEKVLEKFGSLSKYGNEINTTIERSKLKAFITQVYKEAYNEGLSLREAYNDPKLLEKIKQKGVEEERERIINKIRRLKLWSKGTVEGTRADILKLI